MSEQSRIKLGCEMYNSALQDFTFTSKLLSKLAALRFPKINGTSRAHVLALSFEQCLRHHHHRDPAKKERNSNVMHAFRRVAQVWHNASYITRRRRSDLAYAPLRLQPSPAASLYKAQPSKAKQQSNNDSRERSSTQTK